MCKVIDKINEFNNDTASEFYNTLPNNINLIPSNEICVRGPGLQAIQSQPPFRLPAAADPDAHLLRAVSGFAFRHRDAPGAVCVLDPGPVAQGSVLCAAGSHGRLLNSAEPAYQCRPAEQNADVHDARLYHCNLPEFPIRITALLFDI